MLLRQPAGTLACSKFGVPRASPALNRNVPQDPAHMQPSCAAAAPQRCSARSRQITTHGQGIGTGQTEQAALIFELDGALIDMHMDGHRVAFNKGFESLGYECINWPVHVYNDLLAAGDGTPEVLIRSYFERMGWPTMLATSDRPAWVKKVYEHKVAALHKMLTNKLVPLRPEVKQVIDEALAAGAQVAIMSGTLSENSELVVANAMAQLGEETAAEIRVFSSGVVPQANASTGGSVEEEGGDTMGAGSMRSLAEAQARAKVATARQFAASSASTDIPVRVDPQLANAARRVTPELLAAMAATMDVPLSRCVMLASQANLTDVASSVGMVSVAVPRRMAERGVYNGVRAKFMGYGTGECTWGRLRALLANTPQNGKQ
eukprot:CAMPEP_0202881112 /NCGR_PEP_ID=MMETSP1391-20130828/36057_1 /ASSEMBLY_ACC=CAM_ASM_000867 /TAXON_ID=1034604 /ORGANISM="Chlamydomonas leiostraca, Strain SAG 11-49" /LENGTH=376 /DNA_ID=CAMNT_0049563741 /DNA_START=199 /DNA_END=1329 /DNA_ORIENTATION=-